MSDNIKVGILTFFGVLVFMAVLTWKTTSVVGIKGYSLTGKFTNISGLLETADVRYRGYKVGKVTRIEPRADMIMVYIKIQRKVQVPKDSYLIIAFDGLIGRKYIAIVPGKDDGLYCQPGDVLRGQSSAGIVDFVDQGSQALIEAKLLLASLREFTSDKRMKDSILETIRHFEKISADLAKLTPSIENTALGLERLVGEIEPIFADGQTAERIKELLENMEKASSDFEEITGQVKNITNDPETETNIKEIIRNLKEVSEELKGTFKDEDRSSSTRDSLLNSMEMLKRFRNFRAGIDADLVYSDAYSRGTMRAGANVAFKPTQYYAVKAGEISDGQGAILDIIQGNKLKKNLWWHWGIIQTNLGVGVNYTMWEKLTVRGDIFGSGTVKTNIKTTWQFSKNWALLAMAERMGEINGNYYLGFNVRP